MCFTRQRHLYPDRWVNAPAYKFYYICGCLDVCHCVIGFALHVFPIRSASFFFQLRVVCFDSHCELSATQILVSIPIGQICAPTLWAFQTGELLLPHPSFSRPPSSIKQVLPFTSDLIRPVTFAPVGWTPDESLLHLVLCCWLHLPNWQSPPLTPAFVLLQFTLTLFS